jgi:hypothetical protein
MDLDEVLKASIVTMLFIGMCFFCAFYISGCGPNHQTSYGSTSFTEPEVIIVPTPTPTPSPSPSPSPHLVHNNCKLYRSYKWQTLNYKQCDLPADMEIAYFRLEYREIIPNKEFSL